MIDETPFEGFNRGCAEAHLLIITDEYLHHGSLGISAYMEHVFPLCKRFNDGERNNDLYKAILQLKPYNKL